MIMCGDGFQRASGRYRKIPADEAYSRLEWLPAIGPQERGGSDSKDIIDNSSRQDCAATSTTEGRPGAGFCSEYVMLLWRVGREIPNFFILAIRVVRFSPNLAAAPLAPP